MKKKDLQDNIIKSFFLWDNNYKNVQRNYLVGCYEGRNCGNDSKKGRKN